jgi:hypothetical protein
MPEARQRLERGAGVPRPSSGSRGRGRLYTSSTAPFSIAIFAAFAWAVAEVALADEPFVVR